MLAYSKDCTWVDDVTPTLDVDYTFRLKFNYRNNTYSAEVLDGSTWKPLKASGNVLRAHRVPGA